MFPGWNVIIAEIRSFMPYGEENGFFLLQKNFTWHGLRKGNASYVIYDSH